MIRTITNNNNNNNSNNNNDRSTWMSASMSGAMVQCVQMVPGPKGFMQAMD